MLAHTNAAKAPASSLLHCDQPTAAKGGREGLREGGREEGAREGVREGARERGHERGSNGCMNLIEAPSCAPNQLHVQATVQRSDKKSLLFWPALGNMY